MGRGRPREGGHRRMAALRASPRRSVRGGVRVHAGCRARADLATAAEPWPSVTGAFTTPRRRPTPGRARQLEGDHGALSVLPPPGLAGRRLADLRRRVDHPAPSPVPALQPALHHGRDREPVGREAVGRHRAVQPREDRRRRAQGVPGPPGERGRPRAARAEGRGDAARRRARRRSTPTRSGWPSSVRCASSTRWPTCGSRSVYQAFDSLEDFEAAITVLRAERDGTRTTTAPDDDGRAAEDEAAVARPDDRRSARLTPVGGERRRFVGCFPPTSSSCRSPARPPSSPTARRAIVSVVRPRPDRRRVHRRPLVGRPRRRRARRAR